MPPPEVAPSRSFPFCVMGHQVGLVPNSRNTRAFQLWDSPALGLSSSGPLPCPEHQYTLACSGFSLLGVILQHPPTHTHTAHQKQWFCLKQVLGDRMAPCSQGFML